MKEYIILDLIVLAIIIFLDYFLETGLMAKKKFWIFQLIIVLLTTVVDNFSSGLPIVIFNPNVITGIKVGYVPVENYIFGFNLLTLNLILFEKTYRQ